MAIFRAETKHVTRSKKHNVVAAAAYRAGQKLTDTNKFNPDAKVHDYSKKSGVIASGIIVPSHLKDYGFEIDRQTLWSSVEQHETTTRSVKGSRLKQKSRLAREWLLSLPHELSYEENEELTREFTEKLVNDLGVIADYAIHKPSKSNYKPKIDYIDSYDTDTNTFQQVLVNVLEPSEPDYRNVHAHILFVTRRADMTSDGSLKFGEKADSERSEKWRQDNGLCNGGDYIKEIRELWAELVNHRLQHKNILPVTPKSYRDLGLDIIPQKKRGKDAQALTIYDMTQKLKVGEYNDDIEKRNKSHIGSTADSYAIASKQAVEREQRAEEFDNQIIQRADSWLSKADIAISKRANYSPPRARVSTEISTARARERLATERARAERKSNRTLERATEEVKYNLPMIASHLAWRIEKSELYDDRQMRELNAFYKTLNIRDLTFDDHRQNPDNYIAPQTWSDFVLKHVTVDKVLKNPQILKIVADAEKERQDYSFKSLKSDDRETSTSNTVQIPNNTVRTSQEEDLTPIRTQNIFRL